MKTAYPNWEADQVKADDIRAVLQDALENAEDKNNVAALRRILAYRVPVPLDLRGRS